MRSGVFHAATKVTLKRSEDRGPRGAEITFAQGFRYWVGSSQSLAVKMWKTESACDLKKSPLPLAANFYTR